MNRSLTLVIALATLVTLPWLTHPFSSHGEPREALTAQAMLRTGDWILPERYGNEVATKPPLMHWMISAVSTVTGGVSEFTSRLPSALMSVITVVALFIFLRPRTGKTHALWSSLVLLTMSEWYRASLGARVDMTLSAFLVLGFLSVLIHHEANQFRYLIVAALSFAGAFLTKGPVALVLPGAIVAVFLLTQGVGLVAIFGRLSLIFVPAGMIGAVWYWLAYQRGGDQFLEIVLAENFGRFFGNSTKRALGHEHGPFYLYTTLVIGALPWSLMIVLDASSLFRQRLREMYLRIRRKLATDRIASFATLIVVAFIIFYSIPSSKRSVYLLPAYPFLAIIVGHYLVGLIRTGSAIPFRLFVLLALGLSAVAGVVGAVLCGVIQPELFVHRPKSIEEIRYFTAIGIKALNGYLVLGAGFFIALASLIVLPRLRQSTERALIASVALYLIVLLAIQGAVLSKFTKILTERRYVERFEMNLRKSDLIYYYKYDLYAVSYYSGKKVLSIDQADRLEVGDLIGMKQKSIEEFRSEYKNRYDFIELPRLDPELPPHQKEPRFVEITAVMGGTNPGAPS